MMRNDQFMPQGPQQQPMMQPPVLFQAQEPIDITLVAQDWNIVLAGLYKLPYEVAVQVVDHVRRQLHSASPRAQQGGIAMQQREAMTQREQG